MKKLRWRRIIVLFIVLLLVIAGLWWTYSYFMNGKSQSNGEKALPEGAAISLPKVPLTPSDMTEAQKRDVINKLMEDAKAAALKSGQSEEQAENFARDAGEVARQAMNRPSTVDGDK